MIFNMTQKALAITLFHKDRFNVKYPYMINSMMATTSLNITQFW